MFKLLSGFFGGVVGGIVVDLVYINFAGPSGLFTLLGISQKLHIFFGHAVLGGILGVLFLIFFGRLKRFNIWMAGVLWGLICLGVVGGIPSLFAGLVITQIQVIFGFMVWIVYGIILVSIIKFSWRN